MVHDGHSFNDLLTFTEEDYRDSEFEWQPVEILDKCEIQAHDLFLSGECSSRVVMVMGERAVCKQVNK